MPLWWCRLHHNVCYVIPNSLPTSYLLITYYLTLKSNCSRIISAMTNESMYSNWPISNNKIFIEWYHIGLFLRAKSYSFWVCVWAHYVVCTFTKHLMWCYPFIDANQGTSLCWSMSAKTKEKMDYINEQTRKNKIMLWLWEVLHV